MVVYFETSAVNEFSDRFSIEDAIATKTFQKVRNRSWCISPVVLWEIMLTADDIKKEKLIYFSQHLFEDELLPTPEELIIDYIQQGCPSSEVARTLVSKSTIAGVWRDLCSDPNRTIVYDKQEWKQRARVITPILRALHRVIRNENIVLTPYDETLGPDITLESLLNQSALPTHRKTGPEKKLYKLSIFYILFVLCAEVGFENQTIKAWWRQIGVDKTLDRIMFILREYEALVHRGPFITMALMACHQTSHKFSRGIFFDSLHGLYLPYIDLFLTDDSHFTGLRSELGSHAHSGKIVRLDELEITTQQRVLSPRNNPLGS